MFEYNFGLYSEGIEQLTQNLKADLRPIDSIVGIARGGAIPAVHLSHQLDLPCRILHWQTRDGDYKDGLMLSDIALDLIDGKFVLIVDDIFDTGKTITEVDKVLSSLVDSEDRMNQIVTSSLVYRTTSLVKPDYFHLVDPEGWVRFFWERHS